MTCARCPKPAVPPPCTAWVASLASISPTIPIPSSSQALTRLFAFCSRMRSGTSCTAGASATSMSVVGDARRVVGGWASSIDRMRANRAATVGPGTEGGNTSSSPPPQPNVSSLHPLHRQSQPAPVIPCRSPVEPSTGGRLLWPPVPRTAISNYSYPFSDVPTTAMGCKTKVLGWDHAWDGLVGCARVPPAPCLDGTAVRPACCLGRMAAQAVRQPAR